MDDKYAKRLSGALSVGSTERWGTGGDKGRLQTDLWTWHLWQERGGKVEHPEPKQGWDNLSHANGKYSKWRFPSKRLPTGQEEWHWGIHQWGEPKGVTPGDYQLSQLPRRLSWREIWVGHSCRHQAGIIFFILDQLMLLPYQKVCASFLLATEQCPIYTGGFCKLDIGFIYTIHFTLNVSLPNSCSPARQLNTIPQSSNAVWRLWALAVPVPPHSLSQPFKIPPHFHVHGSSFSSEASCSSHLFRMAFLLCSNIIWCRCVFGMDFILLCLTSFLQRASGQGLYL